MKAVILAGGHGSRLSEETDRIPKPMVEIGDMPILWHILKIYSHYGINDFIICLGYKGYAIKEFFSNYFLHHCNVTIDIRNNTFDIHENSAEPWRITLAETGADTMTGGRLKRIKPYLDDETFCMTYGDGLSDIDITESISHHRDSGKMATVTGVSPPGRFGVLETDGSMVVAITEKPETQETLINGGFFVLESAVLDLVEGEDAIWEREPMQRLAEMGELNCYVHEGFWQPMDTLREKHLLNRLWSTGEAPWKVWA